RLLVPLPWLTLRRTGESKLYVAHFPDHQPTPRLPGGVGWLGAGRDGFVHLCAGDGAGAARVVAAFRDYRGSISHRILWRTFVRAVPGGPGMLAGVGTDRRSLLSRAGAHAYNSPLLRCHIPWRVRSQR